MANIMSLKNVRNKASRNGFDLSRRTCFTAKAGELLPVWWKYVLPGDSFTIDLSAFTRTQPVNTASYGRLREYYDFFFVPLEQLWNRSHTVLTQMYDNSQHALQLNNTSVHKLSGDLPSFSSIDNINSYLNSLHGSATYKLNEFGMDRSYLSAKLLSYLGYGSIDPDTPYNLYTDTTQKPQVCLYPLLAYQKVYADFFRFTQWESPNPSTFNVDWMSGVVGDADISIDATQLKVGSARTMFDLRYCNYQKDLFHGIMPNAQFGETAAVPVGGTGSLDISKTSIKVPNGSSDSYVPTAPAGSSRGSAIVNQHLKAPVIDSSLGDSRGWDWISGFPTSWTQKSLVYDVSLNASQLGSLSILALRQAEALQRWKEVAQAAEEDYKQQIQAHWGVNVSDLLSGQSRYLGGINGNVNINEVVNTALTGGTGSDITDYSAVLAGKGIGSQNGKITFNSSGEYGVIMCIYHALPILDYVTSGTDITLLNTTADTFPIPEFDNIGMELLPHYAFTNGIRANGTGHMGFVPRYIGWKTDYDRCVGAFADTLQNWIIPYGDDQLLDTVVSGDNTMENPNNTDSSYGYVFFKVNPRITDPMFSVSADDTVNTDPLLCQSFFDVKVTRNLDVNGLPY